MGVVAAATDDHQFKSNCPLSPNGSRILSKYKTRQMDRFRLFTEFFLEYDNIESLMEVLINDNMATFY
ncbi:hypothetical protein DERF_003336 [Dermatophagoides farinae]|uniref:Uncharacterized protein n=1 Tax=Dermatophagoides farinae TaxID=6954 RepID=A0A922LAG6_DERFA|nr:hypothetical protein DERF_003336 [Dermatophagoides farinae]